MVEQDETRPWDSGVPQKATKEIPKNVAVRVGRASVVRRSSR